VNISNLLTPAYLLPWTKPFQPSYSGYRHVCWQSRHAISGQRHRQCQYCNWFICECGACAPHCCRPKREFERLSAVWPYSHPRLEDAMIGVWALQSLFNND
jgi:hypothetical protein